MTNKGILKGEHITKVYGKNKVLNDVSVEIEPGKIYGLIGRNGAGKTTLLSILTAQNMATEGTITYNGEPVWENGDSLEHICFSRELNAMNVMGPNSYKIRDYLRAASILYPNWDKEYADKLVQNYGLDVKKKISKISKGMMSAVTIIIALASKSDVTILDEPVAGLDVVARDDFYKQVIDEYTETGRTFIISTHIIEEAANLFEEVIILNRGEMLLKENTQHLLERAYYVSGENAEVDKAVGDIKMHHVESMGRSKGVTVLLDEGQEINQSADVTIQPISLQNLFLALCGREE